MQVKWILNNSGEIVSGLIQYFLVVELEDLMFIITGC
jgi:hypothetical protein